MLIIVCFRDIFSLLILADIPHKVSPPEMCKHISVSCHDIVHRGSYLAFSIGKLSLLLGKTGRNTVRGEEGGG